jgi:hypothetical protein
MIRISIDVTRLDKGRFKEVKRRTGERAMFAELVLIETPNSEHGDFIVKQDVTKEERAARVEMPILGNGKHIGGGNARAQERPRQQAPAQREYHDTPEGQEQIPF